MLRKYTTLPHHHPSPLLTNKLFRNREFTTGDIVIKTPKRRRSWIPVSQGAGALITEELSTQFSPQLRFDAANYSSLDHTYPEATPRDDTNRSRDSSAVLRTPQTPQERISVPQRSQTQESNRSYASLRVDPLDNRNTTRSRSKSKSKSKSKQGQKSHGKKSSSTTVKSNNRDKLVKVSKNPLKQLDQSELNVPDIQDADIPENIKILRLPTSSARLTSIDVMIHYLTSLTPESTNSKHQHFEQFNDLNEEYLGKVLDLNLTNNKLVSDLKEVKIMKADLRAQLFEIKDEINKNMQRVEKVRKKYAAMRVKVHQKRKIKQQLQSLKSDQGKSQDKSDFSKIIEDLNVLNNTLDPNWGLMDKLKAVNEKLYNLDQRLGNHS